MNNNIGENGLDPLADVPSDDDNDSSDWKPEHEDEYKDKIYAEHVKVTRAKTKFKIELRNAFMHINGRDYVVKQIICDLNY